MRKSMVLLIAVALLAAIALPASANPEGDNVFTVEHLYCEDGSGGWTDLGSFGIPGWGQAVFGSDNGALAVSTSYYWFWTETDAQNRTNAAVESPTRGNGRDTTYCYWKCPTCEPDVWIGNDLMFLP